MTGPGSPAAPSRRHALAALAGAALLATAVLTGCRMPAGPAPPGGARPPARGAPVSYALDWSAERLERLPGGAGWTVRTDRGYTVTLVAGRVTTVGAEVVACPEAADAARAGTGRSAAAMLRGLRPALSLRPRVARAGHEEDHSAARVRAAVVESLTEPRQILLGRATLEAAAYCRAHYLVGPAPPSARGLQPGGALVGASLTLSGTFTPPLGGDPVPFAVRSEEADGRLIELSTARAAEGLRAPDGSLPNTGRPVTVTFTRVPGALFDGLALDALPENELARAVLRALVDGTRLTVAPTP